MEKPKKLPELETAIITPRHRLTKRLRALKWVRRDDDDKSVNKCIDMLSDPAVSAFDIMRSIEAIAQYNLTPNQRIRLTELKTQAHRAIFGDKIAVKGHIEHEMTVSEEIVKAWENRKNVVEVNNKNSTVG